MYFTAYKESDNGYVRCEDIGLPKKTWATKEKRTESGCGVVHAYIWTEDKIRDIGPTDLKVNLGGGVASLRSHLAFSAALGFCKIRTYSSARAKINSGRGG